MSSSTKVGVLDISQQDNITLLRLNRPQARNALSEELLYALSCVLEEIAVSPAIRAVIITGSGTCLFCRSDRQMF